MNQGVSKEIRMANKYKKKESATLLAVKEMQIKTTPRFCLNLLTLVLKKQQGLERCFSVSEHLVLLERTCVLFSTPTRRFTTMFQI